jgi:hypothetical protein
MTKAKINHDMKSPKRWVPRMRWYTFVTSTPVSVTTAVRATCCTMTVPLTQHIHPLEGCNLFEQSLSIWLMLEISVLLEYDARVTGQLEPDVSSQCSAVILMGRNVKQEWLYTAEAFLGSCQFLCYSRNPPHVVETKFSFPCAQQLAASRKSNDPYPKFNFLRISKNNYFYLCNCMVKY